MNRIGLDTSPTADMEHSLRLCDAGDERRLAVDESSATVEVVDDCPFLADAFPPTNDATDQHRLPTDASVARDEVMGKCQLPADAPLPRPGSNLQYRVPPHQMKPVLGCGKGNAHSVDFRLVTRVSPPRN